MNRTYKAPATAFFLTSALFILSTAQAADSPIQSGHYRVSAQSGLSFTRTTSSGSVASDLRVGLASDHFIFDSFSLGPALNFSYAQASGKRMVQIGAGMNIGYSILATDRTIPFFFVTPGFGIVDTDGLGTKKNFELAGGAGVHFLLNSHIGFGLSFVYDRFFSSPTITTIAIPLSFALYL